MERDKTREWPIRPGDDFAEATNMNNLRQKSLSLALLLAISTTSTCIIAEERTLTVDEEGFCTSLRTVDTSALSKQLRNLQQNLKNQQIALQQRVEKGAFGVLDVAITILAPGGLVYAAIKQQTHFQAKNQLAQVSTDVNQLSVDLLNFNEVNGSYQVAALR
ncbi:MAG: hypothetical protein M3H12_00495 [Chromatiales bacterium]|nr:hypothetical protein [Gammaproteobacteria bacterium]